MSVLLDSICPLADEIVVPGGALQFLQDQHAASMLSNIEFLVSQHEVSHLLVINHLGCGAMAEFRGATLENELMSI